VIGTVFQDCTKHLRSVSNPPLFCKRAPQCVASLKVVRANDEGFIGVFLRFGELSELKVGHGDLTERFHVVGLVSEVLAVVGDRCFVFSELIGHDSEVKASLCGKIIVFTKPNKEFFGITKA
jgi:hypothetical protein